MFDVVPPFRKKIHIIFKPYWWDLLVPIYHNTIQSDGHDKQKSVIRFHWLSALEDMWIRNGKSFSVSWYIVQYICIWHWSPKDIFLFEVLVHISIYFCSCYRQNTTKSKNKYNMINKNNNKIIIIKKNKNKNVGLRMIELHSHQHPSCWSSPIVFILFLFVFLSHPPPPPPPPPMARDKVKGVGVGARQRGQQPSEYI